MKTRFHAALIFASITALLCLAQTNAIAETIPGFRQDPILVKGTGNICLYNSADRTPRSRFCTIEDKGDHYEATPVFEVTEYSVVDVHAHNTSNVFRATDNVHYAFCEMSKDEKGLMIELRIWGSPDDESVVIKDSGTLDVWSLNVNEVEICKFVSTDVRTQFDEKQFFLDLRGSRTPLDLAVNLVTSDYVMGWLSENVSFFGELLNIDNVRGVTVVNVALGDGDDIFHVINSSPVDFHSAFVINAGKGNDNLFLDTTGGCIVFGGEGNDSIMCFGPSEISGGKGDDYISCIGDTDDHIFGGLGNDVLVGGPGDDVIFGGSEETLTDYSEDADFILGGRGRDLLWGGTGSDQISAGADHDWDYIESGSGIDHIYAIGEKDTVCFRQWQGFSRPGDILYKLFEGDVEAHTNWTERHCLKIFTNQEDWRGDRYAQQILMMQRTVDPQEYPWLLATGEE